MIGGTFGSREKAGMLVFIVLSKNNKYMLYQNDVETAMSKKEHLNVKCRNLSNIRPTLRTCIRFKNM